MDVHQLEGCCGIIEIYDIHLWNLNPSQRTKDAFKTAISRYIEEYLMEEIEYNSLNQLPKCFIATTNSEEQPEQELALAELGFKAKKFKGRSSKTSNLKFWMRTSIPKEIYSQLKKRKKEIEEEDDI